MTFDLGERTRTCGPSILLDLASVSKPKLLSQIFPARHDGIIWAEAPTIPPRTTGPNVSKDNLQEPIPDEWVNLRLPDFYRERRIGLVLHSRVPSPDLCHKPIQPEYGRT